MKTISRACLFLFIVSLGLTGSVKDRGQKEVKSVPVIGFNDLESGQAVFTIPKMLRIFLIYNRRLLGELCRCALHSLTRYFEIVTGGKLMPRVIAAIQTFDLRLVLWDR